MKQYSDEELIRRSGKNWLPRYMRYLKRFHKRIHSDVLRNMDVLDIGCGDGYDAEFISMVAKSVVGIDIQKSSEWKRQKSAVLHFQVGNAEKLPFKNKTFSGVFIKDVLHHTDNPDKVVEEIKRIAKRNARLIIVEANRYNPLFYVNMTLSKNHQHFSKYHFRSLINQHFKKAEFLTLESHYISLKSEKTSNVCSGIIEFIFQRFPILNMFQSYNVAYIQNS